MAIIFMDSFDHYSSILQRWDYANNVYISTGRFGNGGWARGISANPTSIYKAGLTSSSDGTLGFAFYDDNEGMQAGNKIVGVWEDGTTHLYVANETVYPILLSVYRGDGTKIGTGTISFPKVTWAHVELTYVIGDAPVGSFQLRINGIVSCSGSSIDTRNSGTGIVNGLQFYAPTANGSQGIRFDDVYLATGATPLGDLRVQYITPSGPGIRTNFTPLSGSNWANVDETTANDNDYNSSNVVGATDLFSMPDLGNVSVHGVQTVLRYQKDDAGSRTVQPVFYRADVDDGGTPPSTTPRWYRGTKVPVYDTFAGSTQLFATSPLSGLSWTKDEINALQFGYAVGDAAMFTIDAKLV
jgi:hypothetical protein